MSRSLRRIELTPGYLLHHRPWRDTSRILEVLTREHGRLTLFARGVRSPGARLGAVLRPFQPLLLSWSGRGEAPLLTGAERGAHAGPLPPGCLIAAFYLNELLLRLTTRHDPLPELYDHYHDTLSGLRNGTPPAPCLRLFEKRLLQLLGYGLDLATEAHTGKPLEPGGYYHFRPGEGLVRARPRERYSLPARSLLALEHGSLRDARELADARRVLRAALEACLEGRPLATRAVAKAMLRKAAQ